MRKEYFLLKTQIMKYLLLLLPFIFFACGTGKEVKTAELALPIINPALSEKQLSLITETIRQYPDGSNFAVALIDGDRLSFQGVERHHNRLIPTENSQAVFEIGSITEVFTVHLLLNALRDGQIDSLDAPIAPHLDFKIREDRPLTFKQLANHTSGLSHSLSATVFSAKNPYKSYDYEKFTGLLGRLSSWTAEPGEKYQYSNLGVGLLGYTLRQVHEESFENLLRKQIFEPLKMNNSTTKRNKIRNKLVPAYNWKGRRTKNWDLGELEGAGAILSTVADLAKYAQWNFKALQGDLSLMKEETITVNDTLAVGLGWFIRKSENKPPFLWHKGETGGYKAEMAIDPDQQKSVIILTNAGATNNPKRDQIDQLCFDLMKTLYD